MLILKWITIITVVLAVFYGIAVIIMIWRMSNYFREKLD